MLPRRLTPGCADRSEEHTSELQSQFHLVCRLLLEKKTEPRLCTVTLLRNTSSYSPPPASSSGEDQFSVREAARPRIIRQVFFFNDTATTEISTLSLHDALPILRGTSDGSFIIVNKSVTGTSDQCSQNFTDRKSTRLNSSHSSISYPVFCFR